MKPKVIVMLGQTSTGKSDLAVKIAKKIDGEIISADSRQVYKGLNLGTGKITKNEMLGVPHHLLDVANPKRVFTIADYKKLADKKIKEIIARKRVPILCGGTGFYIDAITKNIILPEVPPNIKLRKNLEKKDTEELFKLLFRLDPSRAKNIKEKNEQNNTVRLIRAIEIAKTLGKVPPVNILPSKYEFIKIGLNLSEKILKQKIEKRLKERIKKGMLIEAKKLHRTGLSWKRMKELGLEYRHMAMYYENKISKQEMFDKLCLEINHYAKRQATWFRRDNEIKWFEATSPSHKKIINYIKSKVL